MPSPPKVGKKTARARVSNNNLKRLGLNNNSGELGLGNTAILVNAKTRYNFNNTKVRPNPLPTKFNPFNRNAMAKLGSLWNNYTRKNKNKKNGNK